MQDVTDVCRISLRSPIAHANAKHIGSNPRFCLCSTPVAVVDPGLAWSPKISRHVRTDLVSQSVTLVVWIARRVLGDSPDFVVHNIRVNLSPACPHVEQESTVPFQMPPLTEPLHSANSSTRGGWTTVEGQFVLASITQVMLERSYWKRSQGCVSLEGRRNRPKHDSPYRIMRYIYCMVVECAPVSCFVEGWKNICCSTRALCTPGKYARPVLHLGPNDSVGPEPLPPGFERTSPRFF